MLEKVSTAIEGVIKCYQLGNRNHWQMKKVEYYYRFTQTKLFSMGESLFTKIASLA